MFTLRLPFWLADRFCMEAVVARSALRRAELPDFALSGPERRFAQDLLRHRRNLWLWRCHQRHRCGDFVVVDMSNPRAESRIARVIELKTRRGLHRGGLQTQNAPRVLEEVPAASVMSACGDVESMSHWMGLSGPALG